MASKEDQKKDWAEMSDGEEPEQEATQEDKAKITIKKKKIPAAQKGSKNDRGDYVVTTINIPDMRTGVNKKDEDGQDVDESDSDSGYDEEDDAKEEKKAAASEKKEGKYYRVFYSLIVFRKTCQKTIQKGAKST